MSNKIIASLSILAFASFGTIVSFGTVANAQTNTIASPKTIIHAGTVIAKAGEAPLKNVSIIIQNGNIIGIANGFETKINENDKIIDLKNKTLMAGLIDCHVHLLGELSPQSRNNMVTREESDYAFVAMHHAQRTLNAGFTTIADLGSEGSHAIFALRDQIAQGKILGPRIIAAGSVLSVTGGHGDIHAYREDILKIFTTETICDGVEDCRRAVRYQMKMGADIIKATATGGVLSDTSAGLGQQFFDDELKTIADTAHSMGRKATAHAHGKAGIDAALRAGFDSIEHGTYLDKESVELFKKSGAYLIPTVLAGHTVSLMADDPNSPLSPKQRTKSKEVGPKMINMLKFAHENGVKIAFGTDSGVSKHGDNAIELELMVKAGFTPIEAIKSATIDAADHLGLSSQIGTIEIGKAADIIGVDGDPSKNIKLLQNVTFVMKGGIVAK